jgi:hypothetical protein
MAYDSIHRTAWQRCVPYELFNHELSTGFRTRVVRPAPGVGSRYDPWELFDAAKGKYRTAETLWGEFAEIVRCIRQDALDPYVPSPRGESLILDWSNKYGLLGVLPLSAQMIVLPAVYERGETVAGTIEWDIKAGPWVAIQRTHVRAAGTWTTHTRYVGVSAPDGSDAERSPGDIVSASAYASPSVQPPRTLFQDWEELDWRIDEGNGQLSRFFRIKPRSGQYPALFSDEFWTAYQEPVGAWVRMACSLFRGSRVRLTACGRPLHRGAMVRR